MILLKPMGKFTCSCGNSIGQVMLMDQVEMLQIGSGLAREFHGVCIQCGRGVHWSTPDRILSRLVTRITITGGHKSQWDIRKDRDRMIMELKSSGLNWVEIAAQTRCSVSTCKRLFRNLRKGRKGV